MKCPPKQLTVEAEALGFQLLRANKHAVWKHTSGQQVVTSVTPSCKRALQNAISNMRRVAASSLV
jgi:hypothetical protein